MIYANDINGIRIIASKKSVAYCPICFEKLIPKCGPKKIAHWSHSKESLCEYRSNNDMCEWHINWQNMFDINNREFRYKVYDRDVYKIADIYINNLIVEFQHSPITKDEINNREESSTTFGQDAIIWIFDKSEVYKSGRLKINKFLWCYKYDWKHEHSDYKYCGSSCNDSNVFLDIGNNKILYIINKYTKECLLLNKEEIISAIKNSDCDYQYIWKYIYNIISDLKYRWNPRINDFNKPIVANELYNIIYEKEKNK